MNYDALRRLIRKHKSALTRAKNTGDPTKVIAACDAFFADFDGPNAPPLPDAWHAWSIARQDAEYALRRQEWGL
jgi:hypothetical protein